MNFSTLEDINGAIFENQKSSLYEIPITISADEFTNVKIDFCTISRTKNGNNYTFTIEVNNSLWNGEYYFKQADETYIDNDGTWSNNKITFTTSYKDITFVVYINNLNTTFSFKRIKYIPYPFDITHKATLKEIDKWVYHDYINLQDNTVVTGNLHLQKGLFDWAKSPNIFYYIGELIKSDFVFDCTQQLVLGKVNTVRLNGDSDYKPNGSMVGDNVPSITVKYGDIYIPVTFDSTVNDYVFDIDLTSKQTEGKVRFNVIVDTNDVLNATETEVTLQSNYETINNESKLITLFKNGGIGRLGANITLTNDLTITKDVLIIGNTKTINMNSHKIIVPTDKTFKSENTVYTNGYNTIQQHTSSTVELTECTFTNCTGLGSVIDCQLDMESLEVENDFTTNITGCTFTNNDLCILHGGELNIENCTVTGKIGNPNYPYFLYQTDGNATILQSNFNLSSNTQISTDIEFNSCIFICGETATINGYDHSQLQNNNITTFTTTQRNTSSINVTYYYPTISDYITLESSKGYCHSVSDVDYVFKSGVSVTRRE